MDTLSRIRSRPLATPSLGERAGVRVSVSTEFVFAGNARRELEKESGRKVVSGENYLGLAQGTKKARRVKG